MSPTNYSTHTKQYFQDINHEQNKNLKSANIRGQAAFIKDIETEYNYK